MLCSLFQWIPLAILTLDVIHIGAADLVKFGIGSSVDGVVASAEGESTQLVGDLEGDFDKFENEVESKLIKALRNSSGTLAQLTIEHEATPPISTRLRSSGVESNITIGLYCDSCNYLQPTAFDFASQNYSGWNSSWLGFALESFDALFEVDIDLSAVASGELTLGLWKRSFAQDGVVVEVDFQLYVAADASASMTFTTGLNLSLIESAAIMMPALDPLVKLNESQRIGFDQENFSLQPIFNASVPQLEFSVQFSLRTVFSITFEDINVGALYLDLPAFNLTVDTLSNAMSNCQTPPAGTPPDEVYSELIQVNGAYVAELSYELLEGGKTGTIDTWVMGEAFQGCFAFFPGLGSIGNVPPSPKSPNLTAAAITSCITAGTTTTNGTAAVSAALKSLSPGAKAGAVVGTIAGVTIIAALAWYAGRASLNHNPKNGGVGADSIWRIPRPRSGKFFSRSKGGGMTEFSPVISNTPAWQTPYTGGLSPNPNMETQPGWVLHKKELRVTANEVVGPATRYVPIGDDYGMSVTRAGETIDMTDINASEPTKYDRRRPGHAEGLGLLQDGSRPEVRRKEAKRKEISRKSVPGHRNGTGHS